jgi:hypothetical protein
MNKAYIGALAGIFIAVLASVLFIFGVFETAEAPVVSMSEQAPTDFVRVGYLSFDAPGNKQDTPYLVYEEPGAPALTRELVFDAHSYCVTGSGGLPCVAMSVQYSVAFGGTRALIDGNLQEDGRVLVRKLYAPEDGAPLLAYDPGRVYISWVVARRLIEECAVDMLVQTHALDVHLTLKDGSQVVAVEPVIDEVFRIYSASSEACGQIPVATE